ncbi:PREDICTED: fucolectin-like [Nanorana parkeri]|uniref:fucolectin-like n=1 Tax=Nanorana parkeri TaxID=125878 RepID=UPI0008541CE4|nr:PREDICTED: fucolectin-like [Nanorana parkeri]
MAVLLSKLLETGWMLPSEKATTYGFSEGAANVALQGLAFQSSSNQGGGEAHLAIDDNPTPNLLTGSCSQTTRELQPWWTVDLRRGYLIDNVTITSQLSNQQSLLPWAEIHVGEDIRGYGIYNPVCAVIPSMSSGETRSFPCGGKIGRYITVVIPNRIDTLTLCEVQVAVLNIPDRLLGVKITSMFNADANLYTEVAIQKTKQNLKSVGRTLSWGIDHVLQRDQKTCIPMKT